MAYEVEAFGKIIEVPDDVPKHEAYKQIMANKHKLGYDEFTDPANFVEQKPEALDYAKGFAAGANKLVSGVGYLAEAAGANETGKAIRDFGDRGAAYWNAQMSPGGKKAAESQVFVDDPDSITGLRLGDDAGKALLMGAAQSLPSMFAAALPGVAITKGIQALASLGLAGGTGATIPLLAGTAAPVGVASQVIARAPAAVGFGAAEGFVAGGMNAAGLKTSIEGMSDKELLKSPVYQALRAQHGEEKARTMLADQAASDLFGKTAVSTGTIGALTGGGALGSAYQKVTSGAADGILMTGLKGAGQEAIQETPQSGGEKYIENITRKEYLDPSVDPMAGVIAEAASGGAIGAFTGGIVGAGSAINITKQKITPIAEAPTVDDAIAAAHEAIRTEDPTLADVEALNPTDLEALQNETQKTTDIAGQPQTAEVLDIVLPDNTSVKAQWKIVDADQLAASMKEDVNQPRDRTRAASDVQIKSIANAPDYRRLSDSPVMDVGAPVVDQDGRIVAGNGRFAGLSQAYEQGTATEYLNQLRADAARKGLSIEGVAKPVLVRQLSDPVDTRKMAIASNSGTTLQMSALEQANLDAERMKGIENLDVNDLGDIALTPRNLTQLKDSLGSYTSTELGSLVDKGGQLSQEGVKRVRNAMLAKAYGSSPTLEKLVESTDSDMRNVLGALTKSASHIIGTKGDTKALLEAVDTYSQLKATGQPVDNFLAQQDAFSEGLSKEAEGILRFIDTNVRSQKKLTDFFKGNFVEVDTTSDDMFSTPQKPLRSVKVESRSATTIKVGRVGAKMSAGEVVITASGREATPFPKLDFDSKGKTTSTVKRVDAWLIDNAVKEAESRGDEFNLLQFKNVNLKNISQSDKDSAEEYLFGEQPDVPRPFTKPMGSTKDASIANLEKHLKDNGYDFRVEPASVRDVDALDSTKKARKELAEKQAKLFKKKVVFVKANGPFKINGVMVPSIADTIFVDIRTDKAFDAIMAHELSHWMEQEKPAVYKELVKSLKTVIINEAEYAKKYGIKGATKAEITKEIVGDLMGDNFTEQSFWQKVAEANPKAFKDIAAAIIKWLKGVIVKAKANGMGSEQWVKDATKAQDIIAKAVAQYTESESAAVSAESKPKFNRIVVDGIERPTTNSEGKQINNPVNFWKWFGDSKVVDDQGRPKVMYHGTHGDFNTFETNDALGGAIFLAPDAIYAKNFAYAKGSNILPVYVKVLNPRKGFIRAYNEAKLLPNAISKGQDGVYVRDSMSETDNLAVFDPNQIKSAIGNNGDYSSTNNDIRFSRAYHGSPHDHNKFESSKIGTGEGAQAYGYGHYFAESKDVAEWYKENLSSTEYERAAFLVNGKESDTSAIKDEVIRSEVDRLMEYAQDADAHVIDLESYLRDIIRDAQVDIDSYYDESDIEFTTLSDRIEEARELIKTASVDPLYNSGKLYEVELAPEQDEYLLWDEPLSEQSDKVKRLLQNELRKHITSRSTQNNFTDVMYDGEELGSFEDHKVPNVVQNVANHIPFSGEDLYKGYTEKQGSDKRASEYLHSLGIRGIKYLDGLSRGKGEGAYNYVIFDDKDVSITAKFSKAEIENTLIAQHNLTVRNLIHADRMGGLAAPSIAVTDKAHPLTGFGEITLLSTKDLVDPKNGTKIFGSDIYSPRYPSISYDFSGKAIKNLNSLLADGVKNTGDSEFYNDSLESDPFRELQHSSAAMYQFLTEQGKEPNIAYVTPKELPDARLMRFVDEKKDSFDLSNDEDFKNAAKEVFSDKSDRENIDDKALGYITRDYASQVVAYRDALRNAGKVDRQSTNNKLFRQISDANLRNKFDEYLVDVVNRAGPKERIFKGHTNAGKRQYMPHDLDTVIKILKKDLRGGEKFKYGLGSIRAKYSPQFKSIEQIRKSKGMLMNSESFDQVKKEVQAGLGGLNESLASYGTFSGYDNVETMLSDAAKRGISGALKDNGFENVPDSLKVDIQSFLNKLKDMPTEYFEAKILRAVGLGEFSTAIIPDDSTPQVEAILKKNGIEDIRKYKSGDNEDRVKQINNVSHVMFSRAEKTVSVDAEYMDAVNSGDMEKAQQMVDEASRENGYISGADYRMMHQAPNREDYNLATIKESDIVPDDYWTHPQYYQNDATERTSFYTVKAAIESKSQKMWVYRSVPKDIKDDHIRNGDWVSPSREYAKLEGEAIPGGYKIIAQRASLKDLWWDVNSINEIGYDDGKEYAYKNTKNNRKLLDAVTYDDEGNIIPLSKRFNSRKYDPKFSRAKLDMSFDARMERARSMGYDTDNILWSGSRERIDEIYSRGITKNKKGEAVYYTPRFDGIFASTSKQTAESHGDVLNGFVIKEEGLLESFHTLDRDEVMNKIKDEYPSYLLEEGLDEDVTYDALYDAIAKEKDVYSHNTELLKAVTGVDDTGELSWEMQNARGVLAKQFGYDAVSMKDEHGTSYLILAGSAARNIEDSFTEDIKFSKEPSKPTPPEEKLTDSESILIVDAFNENGDVKVNKIWQVEDSDNIHAKSVAFQKLAEQEGYEFHRDAAGEKYFWIKKKGDDTQLNIRVSDHSNVNRGQHFGDVDINLATDDGEYPIDTFASALYKMRNATVNEDGDTVIDGKDLVKFSKDVTPPDETRLRRFQRMNQDSFNRFTVIKEWLAENGQTLSDKADVYGAEERYHSKSANQLEDFREKQRNPLIEKIQKAGYTLGDIEVFLKMQHAQEANAANRKLTGNPEATAYGIEDQEAADYLAEAPENLAKLANELRDITEQTKKLRLDAGVLSQDESDAYDATYKHYIPVKGESDATRGAGKGLTVNFKSKRRLGHGLRDEHVIENILMDHERAILEVERNRVGKHLVMMAAEMQRPDILSIGQPEKRKVLKTDTAYTVEANGVVQGVFKSREEAKMFKQFYAASMPKVAPSAIVINQTKDQRVIASASPMLAENEVNVYMKGHAIRVQINDELLARAYTRMGVEQFSDIVAAGRILNGYLSKVYTGYNPEFILTNMIRDFSSGMINLTGEQGFGMATKALTNYPRMFTDLLKYAATNGKRSTKWIDSYRANGGNTGAAYLSDMERLGNEVSTEYASHQGVISNLKQGDNANAARAAGRKVFNATLKWIYNLNQAGENAMRLAAFKAMLDSGRTVNEAAKVAKNITVNFNRKGERQWAPALYLFYNASVQGTGATGHALAKGKHKGQAWALAGSMAAVGYMFAASFGGGSEDDWDEINDYTKERNMLIKSGDGYVKVPVPYGYGFFWNLGRYMSEAQRTGDWGKMPWHLATSAISELTPFNEIVVGSDEEFRSDQVFMGLLPTAMKIVAQPTFNKQLFTGSELMPESQFDKSQPDRQKMFRSTKGTMYDEVAGWLDAAGIDISPETLKYTTRTFTGGAGSLVDTGISAAMLKAEGAELDTQEIPFVRKAYMELGIKDKRAAYYKVREEARTAAEEFNRARRANDTAKMQTVLKDKNELIALDRYANKLAATIDAARDQQDAVRADEKLSVQEKRLKLKDMEATEAKFYDQYLDVFKTSVKR